MRISLRVLTLAAAAGLVVAACGNTTSGGNTPSGPPYSVSASWGNFTLASSIATKVKNKQTLNFVLSFQTLSSVGAPAFMAAGMKTAADAAKAKYGVTINTRIIGPAQTDPVTQISQIQQAVAAVPTDFPPVQPLTPDSVVHPVTTAPTD